MPRSADHILEDIPGFDDSEWLRLVTSLVAMVILRLCGPPGPLLLKRFSALPVRQVF